MFVSGLQLQRWRGNRRQGLLAFISGPYSRETVISGIFDGGGLPSLYGPENGLAGEILVSDP